MNNVAVVYWSGTGNTEAMAEAVAKGCSGKLFPSDQFGRRQGRCVRRHRLRLSVDGQRGAGGQRVCADVRGVQAKLNGKKIALFGSYGWGDGEWMRNWEADCDAAGAKPRLRQRHLHGGARRRGAGRLREARRRARGRLSGPARRSRALRRAAFARRLCYIFEKGLKRRLVVVNFLMVRGYCKLTFLFETELE